MRDIKSLSQSPYQVVAERPDDDLPCEFCAGYGGVRVLEIENRTIDVCESCLDSQEKESDNV